uniref:Uncharacterized protein n=1 Tax=Triticum urartu TaxID=4572 RepID=A0A8R7UJ10_TRIUA
MHGHGVACNSCTPYICPFKHGPFMSKGLLYEPRNVIAFFSFSFFGRELDQFYTCFHKTKKECVHSSGYQ